MNPPFYFPDLDQVLVFFASRTDRVRTQLLTVVCGTYWPHPRSRAVVAYGGALSMRRGEEFRRRGQECYRLSTQLHHPEHRSFAIELAKAWIGLAEYEERKELVQIDAAQVVMAGDGTILLIAQSEMGQPPGEHLE